MSSFQLKTITKTNNDGTFTVASAVDNSAADALNTYITNYSDEELLELIQLGMEASLKGVNGGNNV